MDARVALGVHRKRVVCNLYGLHAVWLGNQPAEPGGFVSGASANQQFRFETDCETRGEERSGRASERRRL